MFISFIESYDSLTLLPINIYWQEILFHLLPCLVDWFDAFAVWSVQVHGDYSEDVGAKVDRPADEIVAEEPTEIVGA